MWDKLANAAMDIIVQQLPGHIIIDEEKVPRSLYDQVEPILQKARRFEGALEKFDPEKPATWASSLRAAGGELIEPPKRTIIEDPFSKFLEEKGYGAGMPDCLEWLVDYVTMTHNIEFVFKNGSRIMGKIEVEGHPLYVKMIETNDGDEDEEAESEIDTIWLPVDFDEREKVYNALSNLFWKDHKKVMLDRTDEEYLMSEHKFKHEDYRGEMLDYIRGLRKFADEGHRRVVILQGKPGTGKSTLCNTIAKEFDERTLVVTNTVIQTVDRDDWELLMDVVQPYLVIVDDIDRVGSRRLEQSLPLFEDGYYDVPITLFTTNDHHKIPDAFRRPGRVDVIRMMPTPSEQVQREVVEKFVKDIGITEDLPEHVIRFLMELQAMDVPGAHVRELLIRFKIYGTDYEIHQDDDVFKPYRDMQREIIEKYSVAE